MATTNASQQIGAVFGWDYEQVVNAGAIGNTTNINAFRYSPTQLTQGTAAGQADRLYASVQTIAASGSFSITLTSMTDFFGNTISFLRFKILYVENNNTTAATSIAVGNGTNPLVNWISAGTATIQVRNNGCLFLASMSDATGYPIVAGVSDTLKVLNNDGTNPATVKIGIMGCSA